MKKFRIRFKDLHDKCRFLDTVNALNYELDLRHGNNHCDGKSALGVVSLMPENMDIEVTCITKTGDVVHDLDAWIVGLWEKKNEV